MCPERQHLEAIYFVCNKIISLEPGVGAASSPKMPVVNVYLGLIFESCACHSVLKQVFLIKSAMVALFFFMILLSFHIVILNIHLFQATFKQSTLSIFCEYIGLHPEYNHWNQLIFC